MPYGPLPRGSPFPSTPATEDDRPRAESFAQLRYHPACAIGLAFPIREVALRPLGSERVQYGAERGCLNSSIILGAPGTSAVVHPMNEAARSVPNVDGSAGE